MARLVVIWLLVQASLSGRAQSDSTRSGHAALALTVFGKVTDTMESALSSATVELLMPGADTVRTITGDNGKFLFRDVKVREFQILVTMKGYLPATQVVAVDPGSIHVQVPSIVLRVNYQELDPVIVSHSRPVSISGDTLTYNTSAFPVREGSEVEDILRRLPGIEVDLDGNIIVQGKKVTKVTVNGKEFFGGDVLLAIQNLPADIVSKLQIIDDYGDKARLTGIKVEDPAKVLNIVLKPDKQSGVFGHLAAGAGNDSKYANEAFANAFKGERQISLKVDARDDNPTGKNPNEHFLGSYADDWGTHWRGSLSGGANIDKSVTSGRFTQRNFYPEQQINLQQATNSTSESNGYTFGGNLIWARTPVSMLRISPIFDYQYGHSNAASNSISLEQNSGFTKATNGTTYNLTTLRSSQVGAELYYEHKIPKSKQRFSVQAAVSHSMNQNHINMLSASVIRADSAASTSTLRYLIFDSSSNLSAALRSNYYYQIGPGKLLELSHSIESNQSYTAQMTRTFDSLTGTFNPIDSLTVTEPFSTIIQRIHGGYEAKYSKVALVATIDWELGNLSGTVDSKGDQHNYAYLVPLPRVRVNWIISQKHSFFFQYQGSSSIPTFQQIVPLPNVSNPQFPVIGNPSLTPARLQSGSIGYENANLHGTHFSGFGVNFNITVAPNPIIAAINHPKDGSQVIQTTTFVNAGRSITFSEGYHFALPSIFGKHFRVTGNGSLAESESPVITDGNQYSNESFSWNQSLHFQLSIPSKTDIDLEGTYSINHSSFSVAGQLPTTVQSAGWQFLGRQILFDHWQLGALIKQAYINFNNSLRPSPATLTGFLQRDILRHNRANISITGYNLLGSVGGISQTITPTSVTQTQANYLGRFLVARLLLKLQRFN